MMKPKTRCGTQSTACKAGILFFMQIILNANEKTKGGRACSRRAFVLKTVSSFMLQNTPALQATQSVNFLDSQPYTTT